MPLAGRAFLALWNDIVREREPEYDRWHTVEHVPERVAVTGFRGARRYVNRGREAHRYFTLYEVDDLAAFEHPEYRDLVDKPTPWSASMRPDFRNFVRTTCAVRASTGDGVGAAIALLAWRGAEADVDAVRTLPGVVACHEGRVADAGAPPRAFDRVLLVEALDRDLADRALAQARDATGQASLARDFGNDVYDLAFAFPGHDEASRRRHRRPQW